MSAIQTPIVISIEPEPTPEELAAITAAVTAAVREGTRALPYDPAADRPKPSRWTRSGRLEAMRGLDRKDETVR